MKNRIISFVLTLVMLFSCLSLQIFAADNINAEAKMGTYSTNPSASGESLSASELADPIAEYFEKYGTIGKSGGFDLTAAQLAHEAEKMEPARFGEILDNIVVDGTFSSMQSVLNKEKEEKK